MSKSNCPAVKRLMREAAELAQATEHYHAAPLEENLFEWHFTVRGEESSSFQGGVYHGRIIFPPEYPMKPPSIFLLTPNGRFEINRKICLSISEYHPETWQPSWSIRTVLLAIVGFMPTPGKGAIGALDWTDAERKKLAVASVKWSCKSCGVRNADVLLPVTKESSDSMKKEADKYAAELSFTAAKSADDPKPDSQPATVPPNASPGAPTVPPDTSLAPPPTSVPGPPTVVPGPPSAAAPPPNVNPGPVPNPAPAPPNPAPTQNTRPLDPLPQANGLAGLMLIYLLIGLISALFMRRTVRTIYQEFFQPDIV